MVYLLAFPLLWITYEIDWKAEPILKHQGQGRESQKKKEKKIGKKSEPRKKPPSLFRLDCQRYGCSHKNIERFFGSCQGGSATKLNRSRLAPRSGHTGACVALSARVVTPLPRL